MFKKKRARESNSFPLEPEEREFVVDTGASMHMISIKDLSDAEMDTLTKSCSPTIVTSANGEVQTHEEATVYVKELDLFLTMKVPENTPAVLSLEKLCDENGYSYEWINGQKPYLIKNGIRIQCNTENFVPIVVPGLSTSSSSGSHPSTSMTPSRQERPCSTSSSISSSSPTTATSSDSETRETEDQSEIDSPPVPVSSSNVDDRTGTPVVCRESNHEQGRQANQKYLKTNKKETMIERRHPLFADSGRASSEIPEWLQEFRENLVDDEILEHGDSHASSSHELSLEPKPARREDLCKHSVYTHFPKDRHCEICQRTKKSQGPRAGDAMVEPYLVLKILVT